MEKDKENITPQEASEPSTTTDDASDVVSVSKSYLDGLQGKLDDISKQLELNKKIVQQMNNINNKEPEQPKDPYAWIDEEINKTHFDAQYDPRDSQSQVKSGKQIMVWYMRMLKEQGLSNQEIYSRVQRAFETMATGVQVHEEV